MTINDFFVISQKQEMIMIPVFIMCVVGVMYTESNKDLIYVHIWNVSFFKYGPFSLTISIELTWLKCFMVLHNQAVTSAPCAGDKICTSHMLHWSLVRTST